MCCNCQKTQNTITMDNILLAGRWIIQSTNYSLLLHCKSRNQFVDQVEWVYVQDSKFYLESIKRYLNKQDELSNISLYRLKSGSGRLHTVHYIACVYIGLKLKMLIKLDQDLIPLNQFIVQSQSSNCLTIMSRKNTMVIVEKIYFLNRNLKVIKSTIQNPDKYIGTTFSSEIRIS